MRFAKEIYSTNQPLTFLQSIYLLPYMTISYSHNSLVNRIMTCTLEAVGLSPVQILSSSFYTISGMILGSIHIQYRQTLYPVIRYPKHETDCLPRPSTDTKNVYSFISTSCRHLHGVCIPMHMWV